MIEAKVYAPNIEFGLRRFVALPRVGEQVNMWHGTQMHTIVVERVDHFTDGPTGLAREPYISIWGR